MMDATAHACSRCTKNAAIDWTVEEAVRSRAKEMAKRIFRKYYYPPDKQALATETTLQQADLQASTWAA